MTEQPGRRERKKAATRKAIASTALGLFLERGYDAVGIREVAEAADVAVTTVFSHFASKEALVLDRDQDLLDRLVQAVRVRGDTTLLDALRVASHAIVRQFARPEAAPFWQLVDSSVALKDYETRMWLRHEDVLAAAIAEDQGLVAPTITCVALARFVLNAYPLARGSADPEAAVDAVFDLLTSGFANVS